MDVAVELNVTPWEALLKSVRIAAGRAAWVDEQLATAVREATTGANDGADPDDEPEHDRRIRNWMKESRSERTLLARFAKAAIDAGVAERQVRNAELEGQIVAQVIGRVIDKLQLSPEQRVLAFDHAHHELASLEGTNQDATTIEGTWTTFLGGDNPGDGPEGEGGAQPPRTDHD